MPKARKKSRLIEALGNINQVQPGQQMFLQNNATTRENLTDVAKGSVIGWPAGAADLAGLFIQGNSAPYVGAGPGSVPLANVAREQGFKPALERPPFSGDPLREMIDLDPKSPWGMLGEFTDFTPFLISSISKLHKMYKGGSAASKLDVPEIITLTHYSKKGDLEVLDPNYYGTGIRGAEKKRADAYPEYWVNRTHFGVDVGKPGGYKREVGLGANEYRVKIDVKDLYKIDEDPLGLFAKLPKDVPAGARISAVEKQLKGIGYKGTINSQSKGAILFEDSIPINVGKNESAVDAAALAVGPKDINPEDLPFAVNVTDEQLQATGIPGVRKPVDGKPPLVIGSPKNEKFRTGMNRRQVRKMRRDLLKKLDQSGGSIGRYWYEEVSDFLKKATGGRPNARQAAARLGAETSRSNNITANARALDKAWNQLIIDDPVFAGRFPESTADVARRMKRGEDVTGGPKTEPFRVGMLLEEPGAPRPTNDIIMARLFGYAVKDDKTGEWKILDGGLTAAQHKFMDYEMRQMTAMANQQKLGGFDDWTEERLQAAMWVMSKAETQNMSVADAAKHFLEALDRRTMNIRTEGVTPPDPITGVPHLENIAGSENYLQATEDVTGVVPIGITNQVAESSNALAQSTGAMTRPPVFGPGNFDGAVGQPAVSTPLLGGQTDNVLEESSDKVGKLVGLGRGLAGGQEAVGITFLRAETKANKRNAAFINLGRVIAPDEFAKVQARFNDFFDGNVLVTHSKEGAEAIDLFEIKDLPDEWFSEAASKVNGERTAATLDTWKSTSTPVKDAVDAERRWANGEALYVIRNEGELPIKITSKKKLNEILGNTGKPDTGYVSPRVMEQYPTSMIPDPAFEAQMQGLGQKIADTMGTPPAATPPAATTNGRIVALPKGTKAPTVKELKPKKNEKPEAWKHRVKKEAYEHVVNDTLGIDVEHARNTGAGLVGNNPWDRGQTITPAQRRFAEAEGLDPEQAFPGGSGFTPSEYVREYDQIVDDLPDDLIDRFDVGFRKEATKRLALDDEIVRTIPDAGQRSEVLRRTQELIIKGGIKAVRDAVKSGYLPAVILGAMTRQLTQGAGDSSAGSQPVRPTPFADALDRPVL